MAAKSRKEKMREIERAAVMLISREGLNALSFRKVAAASGYALGSVQNFFRTQQELYLNIMEHIVSSQRQWAEEANLFEGGMRLEDFFLYSEFLLPLNEDRLHELNAWDALTGLCARNHEIQKKTRSLLSENYEIMETVFEFMKADGIFREELNASAATSMYYCFLEGLARHMALLDGKYRESGARRLMHEFVRDNFMMRQI